MRDFFLKTRTTPEQLIQFGCFNVFALNIIVRKDVLQADVPDQAAWVTAGNAQEIRENEGLYDFVKDFRK